MEKRSYRFLVVAGEASGDLHAAKLVRALRERDSMRNAEFFGCTGPQMREEGVEEIVRADHLSIIGLPEIARALPTFWRAFKKLQNVAMDRKADAAILIDFPDFNLKLAKALKKRGIKVFYYISPQLWAWRKYRISTIRNYVDLLISILPFEKQWYASHGVEHVEYVGSPLAMEVHPDASREDFCSKHDLDPSRPIISLLPGSRHKEIVKILPTMLDAAALMAMADEKLQFVVALAAIRYKSEVETAIANAKTRGQKLPSVDVVQGETFNALNASDVAAVASGTATLETGIIGTPMAIVYKTTSLNYKLLRPLIDVEHFGLINLIAEKRVAAELIQRDFTAESLSAELCRLLEPEANKGNRKELAIAVDKLGHGGASKRASEAILKSLA
ncbi:MAG TPA: lipid-A-disaccharide synthase [Pyrinomonadaceae bacterium]|jgi:lipid-A-disaccharide synthase|nr:lipid-A-disaccharide synthase [Pyrinomonadaceae bacterium]